MDALDFARDWEAGWNSHDVDRILSHYRHDVVFRSRKAVPITGSGEIVGRDRLRAYWSAALQRQPDLRFRVQHVFEGHEMLAITYLNHHNVLAVETLVFDASGQVCLAAACHNADDR